MALAGPQPNHHKSEGFSPCQTLLIQDAIGQRTAYAWAKAHRSSPQFFGPAKAVPLLQSA